MVIKSINIANQENSYFLDFQFSRCFLAQLLHNIKVDYNDTTVVCDHILITPKGVTILHILSFEGVLTINDDNNLKVNYGKFYKTLPNPIKQNADKVRVVKSYLNSRLKFQFIDEIKVDSKVLIDTKTYITNNTLPNGFVRDIDFIKNKIIEIEQSCVVEEFSQVSKLLNDEQREEIANLFLTDNIVLNAGKNRNKDLRPINTYRNIV